MKTVHSFAAVPARVVVCGFIALLLASASSPAAGDETCGNRAFRAAQASTYLPECRAYERVSPPAAAPYLLSNGEAEAQAAAAGSGIQWYTYYPAPNSVGMYELSRLGADGWSTESITPSLTTQASKEIFCNPSFYASANLGPEIFEDGLKLDEPEVDGYCPENDPTLVATEPLGAQNVFVRGGEDGPFALVNVTPPEVIPSNAFFEDASSDFTHVVFEEDAALTANALSGTALYESAGGVVHLISVLPNGEPISGAVVYASRGGTGGAFTPEEASAGMYLHAVSTSGETVFFQAQEKLYARINVTAPGETREPESPANCGASACTIQLDASRDGGAGGGAKFLAASPNGDEAFFVDDASAGLTADTEPGSGLNLYEYDLGSGVLRDLTASPEADVAGVSGIGGDPAYLYFVAYGALLPGAEAGQPNLYVAHEGALNFIATLNVSDGGTSAEGGDWNEPALLGTAASPDGAYFAFSSVNQLTAYDNLNAATNEPEPEVFRYGVGSRELACVSCNPTGDAPVGPARLRTFHHVLVAFGPGYMQRSVTNDGRVFFDSDDALVPRDINHRQDVYEYASGSPQLLSSGHGEAASFLDASESGRDAYIVAAQPLTEAGGTGEPAVYDVRVEGSGATEEESSMPCASLGCGLPEREATELPTPSSVGTNGTGTGSKHHKHRRHGRCTRRFGGRRVRAHKLCAVRRRRRARGDNGHRHSGLRSKERTTMLQSGKVTR